MFPLFLAKGEGTLVIILSLALYTVLTTEVSFCLGNKLHLSEGESMVYMRKIIRILLCGGGISFFKFLYPNCGILTAILTVE